MKHLLCMLPFVFLLIGCETIEQAQDLGKTIEIGKTIVENQELLDAGKEIVSGGQEIVDGSKAGAAKIISNGKVLIEEGQEVLEALNSLSTE